MRISLIAPVIDTGITTRISTLARRLEMTGADLRFFLTPDEHSASHALEKIAPSTLSPQLPYDQDDWLLHTDLFIYVCVEEHPWLDSARERERGAVALYHPLPIAATTTDDVEQAGDAVRLDAKTLIALVPYADLIFVATAADRQTLVQMQLCRPERIYILPDIDNAAEADENEATYQRTVSQALAQIAVWTPLRDWSVEHRASAPAQTVTSGSGASGEPVSSERLANPMATALAQLRAAASVTLPDHKIRSPTPVVGPLIAWIRKNLTSHLRQPYLDPILQNQERFNWQAAQALEAIAQQLAAQHQQSHGNAKTLDRESLGAARQRVLAAAERLLEIVQQLETDEHPDADSRAAQASLPNLRADLEQLIAELDTPSHD